MTHTDPGARKGAFVPPNERGRRRHTEDESVDGISAGVARQIDENLKLLYRQRVEQDLPADLQALVAQLRDGGKRS